MKFEDTLWQPDCSWSSMLTFIDAKSHMGDISFICAMPLQRKSEASNEANRDTKGLGSHPGFGPLRVSVDYPKRTN